MPNTSLKEQWEPDSTVANAIPETIKEKSRVVLSDQFHIEFNAMNQRLIFKAQLNAPVS